MPVMAILPECALLLQQRCRKHYDFMHLPLGKDYIFNFRGQNKYVKVVPTQINVLKFKKKMLPSSSYLGLYNTTKWLGALFF